MRRLRVSVYAWVVAAALGGCAAGEAEYGGEVRVTSPELVAISPDVQVIADSDEPLFYADSYYWLYRDNMWLRSDVVGGRFAHVDVNMVPSGIREVRQPQGYAHYRRNTNKAIARGGQVQERQPMRPQGTQQYPQQQQQRPMEQRPLDQRPMQNQLPPRPGEPGTRPTEPSPTGEQRPPVANPMPNHESTQIPEDQKVAPTLPSQRSPDVNDHDNNQPDRKIDKNDDRSKSENDMKRNKSEKTDKKRDYGE